MQITEKPMIASMMNGLMPTLNQTPKGNFVEWTMANIVSQVRLPSSLMCQTKDMKQMARGLMVQVSISTSRWSDLHNA